MNTDKPALRPRIESSMSRYVSFVMLVVTILVCGFFFYNVIKGFLLPLFLAVLLAVIFRPFHQWVALKCNDRPALAASVSTSAIMLVVLLPLAGLVGLGLYEANQVFRNRKAYLKRADDLRGTLALRKPFAQSLDKIEFQLRQLEEVFNDELGTDYLKGFLQDSATAIKDEVLELKKQGRATVEDLWSEVEASVGVVARDFIGRREELRAARRAQLTAQEPKPEELDAEIEELRSKMLADAEIDSNEGERAIALHDLMTELKKIVPGPVDVGARDRKPEKRAINYLIKRSPAKPELGFLPLVDSFSAKVAALEAEETNSTRSAQYQAFTDAQVEYDGLRTGLLGGPLWKWVVELLNPSNQQISEWLGKAFAGGATRWLPSITNTATSLITGLLVGLAIMAVALFYFFMDGPKMINTFMHLSPLDDRHELELLQEFDKVSRAVVLATLLSAVAQGILGGIGYKIVGMESIFLLTLLTAVLALVPFVGAAAVWLPCCIYIAFIQDAPDPDVGRGWLYAKAAFLGIYGIGVISMADNLIKPWVLQGQSKLHPLLALLSVLGGVQALGPIGVLVGPMVVAFLQVLLTILQREITSLDEELKSSDAGS